METILFLAHTEADGTLSRTTLEALAAAQSLGGDLVAGFVGPDIAAAARQIGSCGAKRFLAVAGPEFAQSRYATDAAAAEALCRAANPTVVVAAGTSRWSRTLPGVTHRLGGHIDSHVAALN